jgi:hypothetical protein
MTHQQQQECNSSPTEIIVTVVASTITESAAAVCHQPITTRNGYALLHLS